ncbi:MAG TPA: cation:dicarboxylase symporter family transporter, partial [Fimbriimonas sp.]|nr:cation:dicarboxylase symporter family transporter [Fimbriimonas sp.]
MTSVAAQQSNEPRKPWYRILYVQVLLAVLLGIVVGALFPDAGKALKPLGDGFIKLVKMMIAPIIFCTVVHGIASMSDLKRLGRIGLKTLLYFEVVSTVALGIGLLVVNALKPGAGFTPPGETFHAATKAAESSAGFAEKAHGLNVSEFILNIIPNSFLGPLFSGDLLQVLLVSILTAFAITALGERGKPIL